jgi:hypothetical protein
VRVAVALVLVGLVGSSCTSPEGPAEPLASPVGVPALGAAGDRLVVIREDGNLVTMRPDGTDVIALTREAGRGVTVRQPMWSPDGRRLAWVELVSEDGPARTFLATSGPSGLDRDRVLLDVGAFFLQWDPTGSRVAYLGSVLGTIGLGVVEGTQDGLELRKIGAGQPLYVSWSPRGDRLLVHVNGDDLGVTSLDGRIDDLGETPAAFQAPIWLDDGRMVYAVDDGPRTRLVVRRGDRVRTLATVPEGIVFVAHDGSGKIAYRPVGRGGRGGAVYVTDLDGSPPVLVTRQETAAFYWSPAGDELLILAVEPQDELAFTWRVWAGKERFRGQPFLPSPEFLQQYVPFFDQYSQGMTLWSPDGSAFAYAGLHDGVAGIWVQPVRPDAPPTFVSDGSVVAWSSG